MTPDGLVSLNYACRPQLGALDLEIAALEVDLDTADREMAAHAHRLAHAGPPTEIDWPEVELRGLWIDSAGHVSLQGGWIDLPSQAAIDFYGFHVALQRLGFGSTSSGRWIGFDADVNLVEGVTLGGSVRGLQVNLHTGAVSFTGVAVDFEIPGVLSFSGEIDHASVRAQADLAAAGLPSNFPIPAAGVRRRRRRHHRGGGRPGDRRAVHRRQGTEPDTHRRRAGAARTPTQTCFFLALDAELPVGIPLFADVALYGLSGMFATNLRPNIGSAPGGTGSSTRPRRRHAGHQRRSRPAGRPRPARLHAPPSGQVAQPASRRVRARRRGGHRHPGRRLHRVGVDRLHDHPARVR